MTTVVIMMINEQHNSDMKYTTASWLEAIISLTVLEKTLKIAVLLEISRGS